MPTLRDHQHVLDAIKAKGYKTFEGAAYDLNIFGVRSANPVANNFDDIVGVVYKDEHGEWHLEYWQATTDPGVYWLEGYNSDRVSGTAILVPGQYRGVYKLDLHGGAYTALCQRAGKVKVYRDSNRDNQLDWDGDEREGYYGINIHRASAHHTSTQVNKWSAGCQVIANPKDFDRLIELAKKQIELHPTWTKFTYTLLEEADLA